MVEAGEVMKTPLLDGISKQALFPRTPRALLDRARWVSRRLFSIRNRPSARLTDFVDDVVRTNLPKKRHMDLPGLRDKIDLINGQIAKGARPSWKLPKGVKAIHVSRRFSKKVVTPTSKLRGLDLEEAPSLGRKARAWFTLGKPTGIYSLNDGKRRAFEMSGKALKSRAVYIDPWDAYSDIGRYIHAVKGGRIQPITDGIKWDKLGLSMMFSGKPVPVIGGL